MMGSVGMTLSPILAKDCLHLFRLGGRAADGWGRSIFALPVTGGLHSSCFDLEEEALMVWGKSIFAEF